MDDRPQDRLMLPPRYDDREGATEPDPTTHHIPPLDYRFGIFTHRLFLQAWGRELANRLAVTPRPHPALTDQGSHVVGGPKREPGLAP